MQSWKRITREAPEVHGVDREYPGLLNVTMRLSASPPDAWQQYFAGSVCGNLSMHPPELRGAKVFIRPPDAEVEAYVRNVDARIDAANTRYETEALPRIRAAIEQQRAEQATEQSRLQAARDRLSRL